MSGTLVIRLDPVLKEKVAGLARMEGKSLSGLVRDLFQNYIRERDIESHIDQLWDKIGQKLTLGEDDVEEAIKRVRSGDNA